MLSVEIDTLKSTQILLLGVNLSMPLDRYQEN